MEQKTTGRLTGVFYLMLAISGALGFIVIRPMLYAPHDAAQTARNLVEHASLARLGVALELAIVLSQALAALWFFRLFRAVDSFCAGATAAFGLVNAIAILMSAACLTTASDVVADAAPVPGDAAARTALLLFQLSGACWRVGGIFFGLWLIPMGYAVRRSEAMPRALGVILIAGGVGYVVSAFADVAGVPRSVVDLLPLPATIGEFWMIGYLLIVGWKGAPRHFPAPAPV